MRWNSPRALFAFIVNSLIVSAAPLALRAAGGDSGRNDPPAMAD